MADSLKMMAIKGLGVTWLPEYSVQDELKSQALALCDSREWQHTLEIKIYRNKKVNLYLEPIWRCFSSLRIENNLELKMKH